MILSARPAPRSPSSGRPSSLRDRYGRTTVGQSAAGPPAGRAGVRFVTVNYGGWDHHAKIFDSLDKKLPEFDRGFSALIEDMDTRGLLANTLVRVMGEFGRTPKINKDAGRDHWGPAASLLFAGAGVQAAAGARQDRQARGATSPQRPVAPADVAYTVYDALGIDPHRQLIARTAGH